MTLIFLNNLQKKCTGGEFLNEDKTQIYLFNNFLRVDGEFLSKLNVLIMERYRDLNPGTEETHGHDQETISSVEVSRTNSSKSADSTDSDLSKENNIKRLRDSTGSTSSSLFCFRIISATRRFNV